jgi:signal transduction histidine kinase
LPADRPDGLPRDVQTALYRVCQEVLNNIAKHARASRVDIQLRYLPRAVELSIQDDGVGFDPQQTTPGHYGLGMMREHASAAGAALSIRSQPGQGALIVIRWEDPQGT